MHDFIGIEMEKQVNGHMGKWANGTQTAPDAQQVHRIHPSKQAIEFPGDLDT